VDPEGAGVRFIKEQQLADKAVKDAAGDLFPGLFYKFRPQYPNRMLDQEDGVVRCIRCHWEVSSFLCCTHIRSRDRLVCIAG
jgi:hypothetical protein